MARNKGPLTPIQASDEQFLKYTKAIKEFSAHKLAAFGLVSHTTIYQFLKREPVNQETEDAIVQTLTLAQTARKVLREEKLRHAQQALID